MRGARNHPLNLRNEAGGSTLIVAMIISGVLLMLAWYVGRNLDHSIELDAMSQRSAELRRANQHAIESLSQMLASADVLSIPLPSQSLDKYQWGKHFDKTDNWNKYTTAELEQYDASDATTHFQLVSKATDANTARVYLSSNGSPESPTNKESRHVVFRTCHGRKIERAELNRAYSNGKDFGCDRVANTVVTLERVYVTEHIPGRFTNNWAEAQKAMANGQIVKPLASTMVNGKVTGWEIFGLVRRNIQVAARTFYDKASDDVRLAYGTVGAEEREIRTSAIIQDKTDVVAHRCRWIIPNGQTDCNGTKCTNPQGCLNKCWQESITFIPPTADGGRGKPLTAFVSPGKSHPGDGKNCRYKYVAETTGYRGGVHQKKGVVRGWAANVCNAGTMFFVEREQFPDCYIDLVPLRGAGNHVGGCFAPGTEITMADGSVKKVEDIRKGDMVLNPRTGKGQRVFGTRHGYEGPPLIEVTVTGKKVAVTQNHPFMSKVDGLKQARHLKVGELVLGADGGYHPIESLVVLPEEPFQWVHNLSLESESGDPDQHMVLANGIMTGDHFLQNVLEARLFAETGRTLNATQEMHPGLAVYQAGQME